MSKDVLMGYKLTEVGVIPEDWDVCKLGSCLLTPPNYGINAPSVIFSDRLPTYIRITDITEEGRFSPDPPVSVNQTNSSNYYLKEGDLVFARTGASVGKSYLYDIKDGELVFAGFLIRVHPDSKKLIPDYLSAYLTTGTYWNWVRLMSMRSGQPGINGNEYSQLPIPLPPLPEQEAIARVLSDTDALITSLDKLIAKKRDIKQAAMQQLLTGKQRLEGFNGDWEVKRLGDIADITRGASPRPIDSPVWFDDTSAVGWVRISDVTKSSKFLEETTQKLSLLGIKQSRFVIRDNLIMSICATVGRPILTKIDVCIHDGFVVFSNLLIQKDYLYYFLTFIEKDWSKNGQTGSQMNLNTDLIKSTVVSYPIEKPEQQAIAKVLSDMDSEISALEQRRDKTKALKQGMMQELLTGRIRLREKL